MAKRRRIDRPGSKPKRRKKPKPREELLQPMADLLKAAYTFERQLFDGVRTGEKSNYRPAKKYDGKVDYDGETPVLVNKNAWVDTVKALQADGIDPVDYVHKVFFMLLHRPNPAASAPTPAQLLSTQFRKFYKQAKTMALEEIKKRFESERRLAKTHVMAKQSVNELTMQDATEEVLLDEDIDLSPLFRYCLARSMKTPEFADLATRFFLQRAVLQYVRASSDYGEVYGEWIPDDFRRSAKVEYNDLIS